MLLRFMPEGIEALVYFPINQLVDARSTGAAVA